MEAEAGGTAQPGDYLARDFTPDHSLVNAQFSPATSSSQFRTVSLNALIWRRCRSAASNPSKKTNELKDKSIGVFQPNSRHEIPH